MKKKILSLALVFALIIPVAFMFSACKDKPTPPAEAMEAWDGTIAEVSEAVDKVIKIETAEELAGLAKAVNDGDTFYDITIKLECDMDMKNLEWTPIGYGSALGPSSGVMSYRGKVFAGTFDGQGHTLYNVNVVGKYGAEKEDDTEASAGVGFFGFVSGEVKNLTIEKLSVTGNHWVGGIVGYITGYNTNDIGKITNCHVKDATISCVYKNDKDSGDKAGGIVGMMTRAQVTNCSVKSSAINAARDAGQVIGCTIYEEADFQTGNTVADVEVTDNNGTQKVEEQDNIKNAIVGRNDD